MPKKPPAKEKQVSFMVKDDKAPLPVTESGAVIFKPRVPGFIPPGQVVLVPLNAIPTAGDRPYLLVSLDLISMAKGAVIVSGPLLRYSADREAMVAVKATDPLWEIDLKDLIFIAVPVVTVQAAVS